MRMESGIRENITHVSGRTASLDYEQHAAVLCGTVMAVGGGGWGRGFDLSREAVHLKLETEVVLASRPEVRENIPEGQAAQAGGSPQRPRTD